MTNKLIYASLLLITLFSAIKAEEIELQTNKLSFKIPEPTTPVIELKNRIYISKAYWALGKSCNKNNLCNSAVGVLDASIAIPGISGRSKFGSLTELLEKVEKDNLYSVEDLKTIRKLSSHRMYSHRTLYLTHPDYEKLITLLDKINNE